MPIAGAAAGAARSLEEILAEQMLKAKLAQQQQEAATRLQMDQTRLNESLRQNTLDEQFRTRQEDRIGAQDREKNNVKGVRRMIGDALTQRVPLTDMQGMAFAEGIDLPQPPQKKLRQVTGIGPKGQPVNRMAAEDEEVIEYREPREPRQGPQPDFEWVMRGGQPLQIRKGTAQPGDKPYDAVAERKQPGDTGPSAYSKERSARTVQSVDELMGKISGKTAGWGNLAAGIPASDAMNFASELDTLKANIAFNELTAMREASKTGGALGQVSNIELKLLESALGALNPRQSPGNLKAQLTKIKESIGRWQQAQGAGQTPLSEIRYERDANGRLVRVGG